MSALAALEPTPPAHDLMAEYRRFVEGLACGAQGKRLRLRAAERFTTRFSDMASWMQRSTPARFTDLDRTAAWPFVTWCFVSGAVIPDVDLLGARAHGAHFTTWALAHPADVVKTREVALALSWKPAWA